VVSLVPSVTESLLEWGVTPIACTRFCEQPALRHVGGTKTPDLAAIVALAPDLVVMDAEENRLEDHDALVSAGIPVHALAVRSLPDVGEQLEILATRLGVDWRSPSVEAEVPRRLQAFVPIWRRPLMGLGEPTYGSSVLRRLGVANVCAGPGPYPELTADAVRELGPDIVIAPSEPYRFGERHRAELENLAPVVFIDGRDLLWWGVRTPGALARLRAVLLAFGLA
jgi:ABC-type Fe3+-hydroxamate transport system substrate-binding protein